MNPNTHEYKVGRRYLVELFGSLLLYAVVLVVSIDVGRPMQAGAARTLLFLSPMVPFLLTVVAILRGIWSADEYMRLRILENVAIAAAVTATWTFAYGFLENAGFHRLSMFNVWPVMGAVWGLMGILRFLVGR